MNTKLLNILQVVAVPTVAIVASSASYSLLLNRFNLISQRQILEPRIWWEALACGVAFTTSSIIFLWWLLSVTVSLVLTMNASLKGVQQVSLPSWVPTMVKATVTGLFGVGLLSSPALATTMPAVQPLSSVTQVQEHKEPLTLGFTSHHSDDSFSTSPSPSPLFSASQSSVSLEGKGTQTEVIIAKASQHTHLSPLFGGLRKSVDTPAAPPKDTETRATESTKKYIVQPGDTLWSIAEQQLPATASGAEVLSLVHSIQSTNTKDIPTLDSFIYPGQSITLPF